MSDIEGQMSQEERQFLGDTIMNMNPPPKVAIEVGTWLGGGSTLHILRALEKNGTGHLWGIEASREIHDRMIAGIRTSAADVAHRFTSLCGFSEELLPKWLAGLGAEPRVDFVFLDGGDDPEEQIFEFQSLDPVIPVGGRLMAHDAKMRKGKFLVPYLRELDHWRIQLLENSEVGLLSGEKISSEPSDSSRRKAEAVLKRARGGLLERLGRVLPKSTKAFILRLVPQRVFRALMGGSR